jgi:hypothetical protein
MRMAYNGRPFRLQTDEMLVPFEVKSYNDDGGASNMAMACALNGMDINPRMQRFAEILKEIDDKVLATVAMTSLDLMGKQMSLEVLREFFRPILKPPTDPKYSPLVKVKIAPLSQATGQMPQVFNANRTKVDLQSLSKGCRVKLIVTMPYVYVVSKNFGATVKLFQACITKASDRALNPDEYVFRDDGDGQGSGEANSANSPLGMDMLDDDF